MRYESLTATGVLVAMCALRWGDDARRGERKKERVAMFVVLTNATKLTFLFVLQQTVIGCGDVVRWHVCIRLWVCGRQSNEKNNDK